MAEDTRKNNQLEENKESKSDLEEAGDCNDKHAVEKTANGDGNALHTDQVTPSSSSTADSSNLHYEGNVCVYTDPVSKSEYLWNSDKNEWEIRSNNERKVENDTEGQNESDSNVMKSNKPPPNSGENISGSDYDFDGESYCYKDSKTGITYKYDNEQQTWLEKKPKDADADKDSDDSEEEDTKDNVIKQDMTSGTYGYEGDTHTYTDASDGTVYIWDKDKNAWFPKVDEDFLAHYQMNYGFTDTVSTSTDQETEVENKTESAEEKGAIKRKAPQEPSWFEMADEHNTKVYVTNLPLDITEQEFVDVMQKCGLVMKDIDTGKMKIKLYTESGTNQLKGDGLCTYIKIESVDLAIKLLDGCDIRGHKIHVERAKFQMKGSYDPNLKPKKRKKKDKEKLKKMQEKLFDWRPDKLRGERSKHEQVVIVKNLFDPNMFDKDVSLILEYQQDLREECVKCGDVRRVIIYDRHPEGVAQINFREAEAADACVTLLNGRWFGQRKITAETWDGKTKYKIVETEAETQQRLQKWNQFLESAEGKGGKKPQNSEIKLTDSVKLIGSGKNEHPHVAISGDSTDNKDNSSLKAYDNTEPSNKDNENEGETKKNEVKV